MEPVVFRQSPIAEYLEGTGDADVSWGIEPRTHSDSDDEETPLSFAPTSSRSRLHAKKLKPLRTTGRILSRGSQLYELFSASIDSRLSRSENARFLERFRYTIVASQLLNVHVNVTHYAHQAVGDPTISHDDEESAPLFGPKFAKLRYWTGNGFCFLVLSLILGWAFWWGNRQEHISWWKAATAVLMSVLVGIVLFAHNRRRWLRVLRGRTIELASHFVRNSQTYDILVSNAVTFIQEVELVSRGYRLSSPLPPITRLERDSQTRRCARLRSALKRQIAQAMTPHVSASSALRGMIQENDLDKYFDIYEIGREELDDAEIGLKDLDPEDSGSLKILKTLFHRLHTSRRIFLCFLLTLDANGGYSDFSTWKVVAEQLKSLGTIMGDLGKELHRISEQEEHFNIPPTPKVNMSPTNERWRGQLRKLNSLSQALRGLQAKMQVLREESDRTVQESMDLTEFGPHLLAHYDSIGADLKALVDEWENGRALLALSIDKQDQRLSIGSADLSMVYSPVSESPSRASCNGISRISGSAWDEMVSPTTRDSAASAENTQDRLHAEEPHEVIFEAVADPRPQQSSLHKLTREERIKKVQEERVKLMEERKRKEASTTLVKELQTVLINRPQGKRLSVRMT